MKIPDTRFHDNEEPASPRLAEAILAYQVLTIQEKNERREQTESDGLPGNEKGCMASQQSGKLGLSAGASSPSPSHFTHLLPPCTACSSPADFLFSRWLFSLCGLDKPNPSWMAREREEEGVGRERMK